MHLEDFDRGIELLEQQIADMKRAMHVEDFSRAIELLGPQLVDMKRARNALLPLLRLPDELVLCVVKLLRDGSEPAFIPRWDTRRGWPSIFQACSRMRKVRLSSQGQQLWPKEACLTPANLIEADTTIESALDSGRAHSEPQIVDYEGMNVGEYLVDTCVGSTFLSENI
jgi:hypothetical protein